MSKIEKYLAQMEMNKPLKEDIFGYLENAMSIIFPDDYKSFLYGSNGCEGAIGENAYLVLWKANDLKEYNEGYGVAEFAPGLVLIGSDGGGNAYGFDTRGEELTYISVPFLGMDLNEILVCGKSFEAFLEYVYKI